MKYIILRVTYKELARDVPIIFPNDLVHSDVAAAIRHISGMEGAEPVAAGEVSMDVTSAHGGSETLGVEARAGDANMISFYDYFHGYVR